MLIKWIFDFYFFLVLDQKMDLLFAIQRSYYGVIQYT